MINKEFSWLISSLQNYKVKCKQLHPFVESANTHNYIDELYNEIEKFQEYMLEQYQSIYNETVNVENLDVTNIKSITPVTFVQQLLLIMYEFRNVLHKKEKFKNINNKCKEFINTLDKYKYLLDFQ